jgi:hypothetical protein
MDFDLHLDAVNSFNEKGEILFKNLVIRPASQNQKKSTFNPKIYIAADIVENDLISDIKKSSFDREGNEVGLVYLHKGKEIGLLNEGYENLIKLAQNMQKLNALRSSVSVSFLKDNIFEWLRCRYVEGNSISMVDYIADLCRKYVDNYEIWIPIPGISVESDFNIGKIILKPIHKETIDQWFADWNEKTKTEHIAWTRRELQGYAAATIQLNAEPKRASEIAFNESEKAISLLRIFTPENLSPNMLSFCSLSGNGNLERRKYFVVKNEKMISLTDGFADRNHYDLMVFSDEITSMISKMGLSILGDILRKEDLNEFQDKVLASLFLYSRNSLAKEISDKLVYILVFLESILLKDSNEPIMQNIGDRMAYLIGAPEERKEIVQNTKDIYGLRSSYIHHGEYINYNDRTKIKLFMQNAWKVKQFLIHNIYNFKNTKEFMDYIDRIKYGTM